MAERTSSDIGLDALDALDRDMEHLYPAVSEAQHRGECLPPGVLSDITAAKYHVARALAAMRKEATP